MTSLTISLALTCFALASNAHAQGGAEVDPTVAQERTVDAKIEAVMLYQGRAAVTRVTTQTLTEGLWKLRFEALPLTIQPETIEAKSSGGRILSVDFALRPVADAASTPQAAALDAQILKLNQTIAVAVDSLAGLQNELKVIESVGVRAAADAGKDGGTSKLDLPTLDSQLTWMATQRARASAGMRDISEKLDLWRKDLTAAQTRRAALGGEGTAVPSAEVLLAVTAEGPVSLRLSYLVTDARWEPAYSLRALPERNLMTIEFDAVVVQSSGEDWKGVRLSLSTARPSHASSPTPLAPWYVDVREPISEDSGFAVARSMVGSEPQAPPTSTAPVENDAESFTRDRRMVAQKRKSVAQEMAVDAVVGGSGPSVTYTIALPFDAPSDAQLRRRARIASFDAPTKFVYQTQPVVSDGVFLRGTVTNASAFQLLPGRASVFVAGDYVAASSFAGAAPKQELDVFFGADPAVTARRELVKREDRQSGLFGGGLDSVSDYRVTISNGAGRPIQVELLDRQPVSRSDKVDVRLTNNSTPLSTDAQYVASQRPQGILRWDLSMVPTPTGSEGSLINWTVTVSRSKDISITPLPRE